MIIFPANANEFTEETREASPANLLLKIESFSLLSKRGIGDYESRAFEAGGYKWKLIMNFGGDSGEDEDCHISVYFSIAEPDSLPVGWEVNCIFTVFVHNQIVDSYLCFRGMARRFNAISPKWGFSKLISVNSLMDPSKGYVVDDVCVFGAEVFVIQAQRVSECLSLLKDTAAPTKRDWKISGFSKLEDVWMSEEFVAANHSWRVQVYPKGDSWQAKGRFVSIFLECVSAQKFAPHHKVKAEVSLRIKSNHSDSHCLTTNFNHWFTLSMDHWGQNEVIAIDDMRDFLMGDCLILQVEVSVQALVHDQPII